MNVLILLDGLFADERQVKGNDFPNWTTIQGTIDGNMIP